MNKTLTEPINTWSMAVHSKQWWVFNSEDRKRKKDPLTPDLYIKRVMISQWFGFRWEYRQNALFF